MRSIEERGALFFWLTKGASLRVLLCFQHQTISSLRLNRFDFVICCSLNSGVGGDDDDDDIGDDDDASINLSIIHSLADDTIIFLAFAGVCIIYLCPPPTISEKTIIISPFLSEAYLLH